MQLDNIKCTVIIALEMYHDLKTWDKDHSRSLEITPFNRSHMASYSHYIVTYII